MEKRAGYTATDNRFFTDGFNKTGNAIGDQYRFFTEKIKMILAGTVSAAMKK